MNTNSLIINLVLAAIADRARIWLVIGPVLLLICFLYLLLFVIFPRTDRRIRRAWATCMPLALVLIAVDSLAPLDPYTFRGFDGIVQVFALMLFVAPMVLMRSPAEAPRRLRGRSPLLVLFAALFPAVLTGTISRYWPGFWDTQIFVFALIAYVTFVIAAALVRTQQRPRGR